MPRCNGSYIGIDANPNANVASGIWTVREAETYLRANQWPATPTVPGAPTGTAGDQQVALTWTAPTGGSTPTDYEVQYSSNGGSTWTTFSDGVSTSTSATVTGLTNGTGYIFRVRAVNALGEGPYGSASGTVTPLALNVSLLLHFDGSNGSTTFTDSSSNNLTVTASGDAQISTAQSKFGGSSVYFDGSGDYLSIASDAALGLGTDDFTIEFWVYPGGAFRVVCNVNDYQSGVLIRGWEPDGLYVTDDDAYLDWSPNTNLIDNQWQHIAVERIAGEVTLYVDGVSKVTGTRAGDCGSTGSFMLGASAHNTSETMQGYIDELRIVKGVAVYGGNFTPPTAPF